MPANESIKKPLKEWLNDFHDDTGKISELTRNLALAGIGIIWIFKNSEAATQLIPKELVDPLTLIITALLFDLIQYIWRAVSAFVLYKYTESKYDDGHLNDEDISDVKTPEIIPVITWIFFLGKVLWVAVAYFKIYQFLIPKVGF